ncbi:MAG: GntR family transcriptional regulator [Carnobacterium sp.]|uniref:GntR family transcriptional regulator n=1 Tax=Carnobacterium sp. TaxID=48221 RepID=UPI00331461B5
MKRKKLLYADIADDIRKNILNGIYAVGEQIPTENELEEKYNVSKITIRKAIEILAVDGYVEKKSGKGTTVISDRLFNKLSKAASFSSIIEMNGHKLRKEIIAIEEVQTINEDDDIQKTFKDKAYKLTRIYYLDEEPYIYFEHFLPVLGTIETLKQIESVSLYKWLAEFDKNVGRFQDSFEVVRIEESVKEKLNITHTHLLKRVRKTFSTTNEIIEISHAIYDTSKYPYIIDYEV